MDFLNVLLTIEINCPLSLNSKFAFTLLENIVIADYRKNRSFVRQMIRKWNLFFPLGNCISFLFVLSKVHFVMQIIKKNSQRYPDIGRDAGIYMFLVCQE